MQPKIDNLNWQPKKCNLKKPTYLKMTTLQVQPEKPTLRLNLYLIPNLFPLPKPYNLTFTASNPNLPSTFYPKPLY